MFVIGEGLTRAGLAPRIAARAKIAPRNILLAIALLLRPHKVSGEATVHPPTPSGAYSGRRDP